jgi:hypothetical protein
MAANEAVLDIGLVLGLLCAGLAGAIFGVRGSYVLAGLLLILAGACAWLWMRPIASLRLAIDMCERVDLGDRVLLRVSGTWSDVPADSAPAVTLRVGDRLAEPLPDRDLEDRAWRGAYALTLEEADTLRDALTLITVEGDVAERLPRPTKRAARRAAPGSGPTPRATAVPA